MLGYVAGVKERDKRRYSVCEASKYGWFRHGNDHEYFG